MDTKTNSTNNVKTTVFNLIILDESGSMGGNTEQTISGCNEILNVIREDEKNHSDTRRNLVSIYAFQSGGTPSRYLMKNAPAADVNDLTTEDYRPCGCTPLLDAIGMTLVDLEAIAATHEDADAVVTISTGGYENSSTEYTYEKVAAIISRLKERGWTINFMGANIDEVTIGRKLNIDKENIQSWESTQEGTYFAMRKVKRSMSNRYSSMEEDKDMPVEMRCLSRKIRAKKFFDNKD